MTSKESVPKQEDGFIITAKNEKEVASAEEAVKLYEKAKLRLLDVNNWNKVAKHPDVAFRLMDSNGNVVQGDVKEGYYFRIDIPGPGTKTGEGYDWARIEKVESEDSTNRQSAAIRVRPAANPQRKDEDIAHFYAETSTSTFSVKRESRNVTAAVYDRNIKPNADAEKTGDKIRNVVTGIAAIMGFSKLQWESLVKGLLEE